MNYQSKEYYCGPAAIQNALEVHNVRVAQEKLALEGATTEEHGTPEEGMKRIILSEGFEPDEYSTDLSVSAWGWLWNSLLMGRPVVLCVDRWEHWVTAIGICGKKILVFDPARTEYNKRRNGVRSVSREKLMHRWEAAKRVRGSLDRFYGIGIGVGR